jgi:uncharacterized protein involved in exopolysaccharide biosynthesis
LTQKFSNTQEPELETPLFDDPFLPQWNTRLAGIHILPQLRLLWTARRTVLCWIAVGCCVSILLALLIPKEYVSNAQLMPPDSESGGSLAMEAALATQGTSGLGSLAGELLGVKTTGALFIAVMHSRTVQDRIIARFNLKKVYRTRLQQEARKNLESNTGISEDRKSGVIALSVTDRDAHRAAAIAGAYIDELDSAMAQLNTSSAHRERVFLEGRLLESAEQDFSQFASKNGAIDITAQGKAMLEGAATLQGQLIASESQLEGLRQIYSDNNVHIRAIQARIAELRNQQHKLGGTYNRDKPPGDDSASNDAYPTLRQLPILGVPYADKFRQLKVQEAVFETLTKEFESAKVQEAKGIPSIQVLDAPEVPERRSFPPRLMIISGGTACAGILGGLWILGSARWRQISPQHPGMLFVHEIFGNVRWPGSTASRNNSQLARPSSLSAPPDEHSKAQSA